MNKNTQRIKVAMLVVGGALSLMQSAYATTNVFAITNRDLTLSFRKTGATGGSTGPNNFEVNVGQASQFYTLKPGTNITVAGFSAGQLNIAFDNLNDMSWSVGGCVPAVGDTGDPSVPDRTLWVTRPRSNPGTQSTPWTRNSATSQGGTAGKITSIMSNARYYSSTQGSDPNNNTPSAVAVPVGSGFEYGAFVSAAGNYGGTFQGKVEAVTPAAFSTSGVPSRLDLYELRPDSTGTQPPGKFLGYFELKNDGTVSFVAAPWPSPTLTITAAGGTNTITFLTSASVNGFNPLYTLYFTNAAGISTPTTTWPFVSTNITGDGGSHFFQDTSAASSRVYRLLVQ